MAGEWYEALPTTLTVEHGGTQVPVAQHPFVKESPDLGHFVNKALATQREVGSRLPLKKADTPEAAEAWRKENLPKLYQAGLLAQPPATPKDYGIVKPDKLPEGLTWNDDNVTKLTTVLHKYGVPKEAAAELLALHADALLGAEQVLKTSSDEAMLELKREFGDKFDTRIEEAKRLTKAIFKKDDEVDFFEKTGLGNHPAFLAVMMRLAPLAAQDSSFIADAGGDGSRPTGDSVRAILADIMGNPQNPKHKLFHSRDPQTLKEIDDLYKKAYGTGTIQIG